MGVPAWRRRYKTTRDDQPQEIPRPCRCSAVRRVLPYAWRPASGEATCRCDLAAADP
jgi:hypothetical protein